MIEVAMQVNFGTKQYNIHNIIMCQQRIMNMVQFSDNFIIIRYYCSSIQGPKATPDRGLLYLFLLKSEPTNQNLSQNNDDQPPSLLFNW